MNKNIIFATIATALLIIGCGSKNPNDLPETMVNEPGDSTVYGLACDFNDSIIEVLPYDLSDPKTYDVLKAWKNRDIYGMPKVGDNVAIILSDDGKSALKIVNIDQLKGKWCYMEVPTLRRPSSMDDKQFAKLEAFVRDSLSDSVRAERFKPIEYGMTIEDNNVVSCMGMAKANDDDAIIQLAEYKKPRRYNAWKIFNGELILTKGTKQPVRDTVEFKIIKEDSLVIFFKDGPQSYYRKKTEEESSKNTDK